MKRKVVLLHPNKGAFTLVNPSDEHLAHVSSKYQVLVEPNIKHVLKVPPQYWAQTDGQLREMTREEKSKVDEHINWSDAIHKSQIKSEQVNVFDAHIDEAKREIKELTSELKEVKHSTQANESSIENVVDLFVIKNEELQKLSERIANQDKIIKIVSVFLSILGVIIIVLAVK